MSDNKTPQDQGSGCLSIVLFFIIVITIGGLKELVFPRSGSTSRVHPVSTPSDVRPIPPKSPPPEPYTGLTDAEKTFYRNQGNYKYTTCPPRDKRQ
jgi:hypothetical protein